MRIVLMHVKYLEKYRAQNQYSSVVHTVIVSVGITVIFIIIELRGHIYSPDHSI